MIPDELRADFSKVNEVLFEVCDKLDNKPELIGALGSALIGVGLSYPEYTEEMIDNILAKTKSFALEIRNKSINSFSEAVVKAMINKDN